ncbi:hypothetical protein D3C81_1941060 [compost metagenome]
MPLNSCVPLTVTVPAAPWNTAKSPAHGWLTKPLASVQLVPDAFQVPLPPSTTPLAIVWLPSQ